jgi:hypothetical protein
MRGRKSERYKHVYSYINHGKTEVWGYLFTHKGVKYNGGYKTEREAALQCDIKLINLKKEPVNILIKK